MLSVATNDEKRLNEDEQCMKIEEKQANRHNTTNKHNVNIVRPMNTNWNVSST